MATKRQPRDSRKTAKWQPKEAERYLIGVVVSQAPNTRARVRVYIRCSWGLAEVVGPLGVAHVAGLEEFLVHGESARERVWRVSDLGHLEVLVE